MKTISINSNPQNIKVTTLSEIPGFDEADEKSFDEGTEVLSRYCEENDAEFYSRPREDFSIPEAIEAAIAAGKKEVVVDDLS